MSNTSNINTNEYLENLLPITDSNIQLEKNAVVLNFIASQSNLLQKRSNLQVTPFSLNTENTETILNLNDQVNNYSTYKKINIIDNASVSNSCELYKNENKSKNFNSQNTTFVDIKYFKNQENSNEKFKQRRRRLRRHPVWNFFKDVEDKVSLIL